MKSLRSPARTSVSVRKRLQPGLLSVRSRVCGSHTGKPTNIHKETMIEQAKRRKRERVRLWLAFSVLAFLLALAILPPYISVNRYRNRVTQAISASIERPVRLSSIELRILPRPSFVLTDLVVEEDPAYGAEPVLHANTVTAAIRLTTLWRGRLQISRISVDEASLNLVRSGSGRWNLDSFFRNAARAQSGSGEAAALPFPYLEATNSRVNIKNSAEKLPFSLVNADLSVWQDTSAEWRVRLRGQPARTDVSLDMADTGVVRLEASLRRAPAMHQMPIHLDLDWKEAQLGQLSRLLIGSDEGWRGDLAGEIHLDGTAESAQVKTRLRASGVHRAEFAPASPIDFDATCGFVYHYANRGAENILCDSPIGDGRARLTGNMPGLNAAPQLSLELDRVPVQILLDGLRTVRRGLDPSLQAGGIMSGKISYASPGNGALPAKPMTRANGRAVKSRAPVPGPLSGSVTVVSVRVTGDNLTKPIQVAKMTIEPVAGEHPALATSVAIPAGAPLPLSFSARLSLMNYQVGVHGSATLPRLIELAKAAGIPNAELLADLDGPAAMLDLNAEGPWMPPPVPPQPPTPALVSEGAANAELPSVLVPGASDRLSGTVTLHGAIWKPDFLASPVQINAATLHLDGTESRWDPVAFAYGPLTGSALLRLPIGCGSSAQCPPQFGLRFSVLDAAALQSAILGAPRSGTMLSNLLARIRPSSAPGWPEIRGTVQADAVILGPVTFDNVTAGIRIGEKETEISAFDATLLGGRLHATGTMIPGDKPAYKLEGRFEKVNASEIGQLLGMTSVGEGIDGAGHIELSGFTDQDLASSAKGARHFEWRRGAISDAGDAELPPALARFDRWTADAEIANGAIALTQNQIQRGARKLSVEGAAVFGDSPHVSFGTAQDVRAAKR